MNTAKTLKMSCIKNIFKKSSIKYILEYWGFPGGSDSKESTHNVGDLGSIPGLGRSSGEGKGYPLQYSGMENSMQREAWQATIHTVHGVTSSQTQLSD